MRHCYMKEQYQIGRDTKAEQEQISTCFISLFTSFESSTDQTNILKKLMVLIIRDSSQSILHRRMSTM